MSDNVYISRRKLTVRQFHKELPAYCVQTTAPKRQRDRDVAITAPLITPSTLTSHNSHLVSDVTGDVIVRLCCVETPEHVGNVAFPDNEIPTAVHNAVLQRVTPPLT